MGIGSAIGGFASIANGFANASAASKAGKQAEGMYALAMQNMQEAKKIADDFAKQVAGLAETYGSNMQFIWDEWNDTFGDYRTNLVDSYASMTPDKYATEWKANIETELNKQFDLLDQSMAQTGVYTSGMKQQLMKERRYEQAKLNAMADMQAPEYVRNQQTQFYGMVGAPERAQALAGWANAPLQQANLYNMGTQTQMNARNMLSNLGMQQAQGYLGSSAGYGQAAGNSFGMGLNLLGKAFPSLFGG